MSDVFLTVAQVRDLTGLTQPSAQIRWLRKNGVTHYVRVDGHPRVPISAVTNPSEPKSIAQAVPDFDAVRVGH